MSQRGWDQSKWDVARWDIFTSDEWLKLLNQFKKTSTPIKPILLDGDEPLLLDGVRECRLDVYTTVWRDLKERFKKAT